MKVADQQLLRERVFLYRKNNTKAEVVRHFTSENYPRSTIYNILKRYEDGLSVDRTPKTGRPPKLNKRKLAQLKKLASETIGASQRKLARTMGVSQSTIHYNLKKLNLKRYKRVNAPKYSDVQLEQVPIKCRKLLNAVQSRKKFIVMDDEKYFTLSNSSTAGNAGFYTTNIKTTSAHVKFAFKKKFEPKVLVWLAISSKGVSKPFINTTKGFALNAQTYMGSCLPNLVEFIEENHREDDFIFWPDLASCHYAKTVQAWLQRKNIPFVPKAINPPNVPQARPIESFWSILSGKVYENGWEAKSKDALKERIEKKLKEVDNEVIKKMMDTVKQKLFAIGKNGPLSVI